VSVVGWDWAVCCVVAWSFDADLPYSHASAGATIAAMPHPNKNPISFARITTLHFAPERHRV
jgi:hypothetical protein